MGKFTIKSGFSGAQPELTTVAPSEQPLPNLASDFSPTPATEPQIILRDVERIVEVPVDRIQYVTKEVIKEVPVEVVRYVEKFIEIEKPIVQTIEKFVDRPIEIIKQVEIEVETTVHKVPSWAWGLIALEAAALAFSLLHLI